MLHVVAAVDRGLVVLRPVFRPLDRPAEIHRGETHQRFVGIRRDLAAEPAAHLERDHPELMLRDLEHQRAEEPVDVRVLAGDPEGQLTASLVVARHGRAGLHRGRQQPLVHNALLDRHLGAPECRVRVAAGHHPGEREVPWHVVVELRRATVGHLLGVHAPLERLVIHVDEVDRVAGGAAGRRHDHRHAVADVTHLVVGQQRVRRHLEVAVGHVPGAGNRGHPVLDVGAGVDRDHAGRALRRTQVDAGDPRVGVGAPEDRRVGEPGKLDVVGVGCGAGDESGVLPPLDRGAEDGCHGGRGLRRRRTWIAESRQPPEWPRRCSGSRCSGSSSPRSRGGSAPPSGPGCWRAGPSRS